MGTINTNNAASETTVPSLRIEYVEVRDLFGIYSYNLELDSDRFRVDPNLMILYGDNGSGKTTILRLIFHLLSPERKVGHRTYLARTPFRAFRVRLSDGTVIAAVRPPENLVGEFSYEIYNGAKLFLSHRFRPREDGRVHPDYEEDLESFSKVLSFLEELGLKFHYLGDDRKVATDYDLGDLRSPSRVARARYERLIKQGISAEEYLRITRMDEDEGADVTLRSAVRRAEESVRREAFARSTRGSESANSVYTLLIERLIGSTDTGISSSTSGLREIQKKLTGLQLRNKSFEELGLSPPLDVSRIQTLIRGAPKDRDRRVLIAEILEPYVDGITARLNELQALHDTILTFLGHLNDFYTNKHARFYVTEGVRIFSMSNEELPVEKLSSGEKQLLLMLCNALSARNEASVFIIDEPEISLNVKWQRRLIQALLDCMQGSSAQFLFATHSIEIVTKYRGNLVRLTNLNDVHAERA